MATASVGGASPKKGDLVACCPHVVKTGVQQHILELSEKQIRCPDGLVCRHIACCSKCLKAGLKKKEFEIELVGMTEWPGGDVIKEKSHKFN